MFVFTQDFLCLCVMGQSPGRVSQPQPAVGRPMQSEDFCIDIRVE